MLFIIELERGVGKNLHSAVHTAGSQEHCHSLASAGRPGLSCPTHSRGECRSAALEPVCTLGSPGGELTRCPAPRDSDSIGLGVAWALVFVKDPGVTLMAGTGVGGAPLPQAKSSMSLALVSLSVIWGVECLSNRIFPVLRVLKTSSKFLGGNQSTSSLRKGIAGQYETSGFPKEKKIPRKVQSGAVGGKGRRWNRKWRGKGAWQRRFLSSGFRDGSRFQVESVWGGAELGSGSRRCGRPRARELTSGEPL